MNLANSILALGLVCGLFVPAYARCPVNPNTTLVIRAEVGDLQIDTTGRDAIVDIRAEGAPVRGNCTSQRAEYNGSAPGVWKITVPRMINLDLVTVGGSIAVGDLDGNVFLRTSGGFVTVGNIRGEAAISTLGGGIKCGNIGGSAGIYTTAGRIIVGNVAGARIEAEAGRTIMISKARDVKAFTTAGDISIGEAVSVNARSSAGQNHRQTRRWAISSSYGPRPHNNRQCGLLGASVDRAR